ncbi:hypothetical protein CONCODRAFT_79541 [Conidiobolus coronatus NRRL 28638]|uniref:Nascent polypeptide-associated complex subunit alpha-like UBA domain-containing protein n=1 Tax=Conidiobolus coronatus (strain ATCC 28846 / CBS 209.66 / NRRL 28638) TaxID=796925 RepID=A0A137P270_CONC2|nr:hypothetical protein CONCODRAFT_79541 [Conidiobolus coronatus NRRL 28638]|eukprot:KXN68999.1 hypothetical protein CONCODRAFT_79541 [Conidiobolus coronatus NRRL 28638]
MAGMTEVEQTHLPQTRVKEALEFFKNDVQKRQTEIAQSKKALDKITIQKEHIPILKNEFELDETQAENVLRENGGDLKKAVESLLLKA